MRYIMFLLLTISAMIIEGCSDKSQHNTVLPQKKTINKASFKMATVQKSQPEFFIELPGELKPYEQVNIYPRIKGFVKHIYADRGSFVQKGQLLALLEAPELGQQYAAMRSSSSTAYQKYLFSRQAYNRLKEASKKNGAVAIVELEKAYAQLLGDSAAYNSSRSEASASGQIQNYLHIRAPFSGVITGRFVSEGALVGDNGHGEAMFQLSQQHKLRLTVAIPERDAHSMLPHTSAEFTVIDLPGKTFTASLSRNSGALDVQSRAVIAEFDLQNTSDELRAGQYARVKVRLKRPQPTLWVPSSSIVQGQSGVFVIKNEKNTTKRIPVQAGVARDSLVEVYGALQEGDKVLHKGSEEIKEGIAISSQ